MTDTQKQQTSFEEAGEQDSKGLFGEFFDFMKSEAKWWLIPFLIVFGLLGLFLILAQTGAAPFIYTLF